MKKLITISREYGSGGRIIAGMVAEKLGISFYDREIIDMAVEHSGLSREVIATAELRAKNILSYSLASAMSLGDGFSSAPISINEKLFQAQSNVVREIAEKGEGVIVGRCADYILRDIPGVTNVFFYNELEDKMERCISTYGVPPKTVQSKIKDINKARANYYNYHTSRKWGQMENYNICLNTSYISDEDAADLIVAYMNTRLYK